MMGAIGLTARDFGRETVACFLSPNGIMVLFFTVCFMATARGVRSFHIDSDGPLVYFIIGEGVMEA